MHSSRRTKEVVLNAYQIAQALSHAPFGTAHLLLGILNEPTSTTTKVLNDHGVNADTVYEELVAMFPPRTHDPQIKPTPTPCLLRAIEEAKREVVELGVNGLCPVHLFRAITRDPDCEAMAILRKFALPVDIINTQILEGILAKETVKAAQ